MEEIWKDINSFEGLYQISNLGNVKSLKRFNKTNKEYSSIGYYRKEKILKPIKNKNGYLQISLSKNGKSKIYFIHKLVAKEFLNNDNNFMYVNHKDENKLKKIVNQYDLKGNFIKQWKSALDVEKELGINRTHIGSCINNNRKSAGGYVWKKEKKK